MNPLLFLPPGNYQLSDMWGEDDDFYYTDRPKQDEYDEI